MSLEPHAATLLLARALALLSAALHTLFLDEMPTLAMDLLILGQERIDLTRIHVGATPAQRLFSFHAPKMHADRRRNADVEGLRETVNGCAKVAVAKL